MISLSLNNVVLIAVVRLRETLILILRDHLCWVSCGGDVVWGFFFCNLIFVFPFEVDAC